MVPGDWYAEVVHAALGEVVSKIVRREFVARWTCSWSVPPTAPSSWAPWLSLAWLRALARVVKAPHQSRSVEDERYQYSFL